MSLRDDLAEVLSRDPRYPIQAYAFVLEALESTKIDKKKAQARVRPRGKATKKTPAASRHVTGRELCDGARRLALDHYGLMAISVLALWGIRSTSDIGEIVYNLIASGDLEKTPADSREDFDNVFAFEEALRRDYVMALDEVA
ncbi:Verruc_Plancto-restricted protein [Singulisphaera sp. GP187]|uniref:Minf_1886 family protein n=1 Tax=Singulisphaera sp. GP187 TaxID=1882752 RepID=UPI00092AFF5E|nr:Minf_1886 family protein [Singulisphaera sp. GP187]SIO25550.1 Verruc_Plancto-restricted protein [Singulisphaera sp. GP187]